MIRAYFGLMGTIDKRLTLMNEMLGAMTVVKFYSW